MAKYYVPFAWVVLGVYFGLWAAIAQLESPVGGVSEQFCKRPEKPCTTFEYEVNK